MHKTKGFSQIQRVDGWVKVCQNKFAVDQLCAWIKAQLCLRRLHCHVRVAISPSSCKQSRHNQIQVITTIRLLLEDSNHEHCYHQHRTAGDSSLTFEEMNKLARMGWYWGSISPEYAAKLLEHEQDGSFLIRDSSSACHIFSMTFKIDGNVHHARIERSNGCYSFTRSRKFFCSTIVDFIEQAIEYSQNGNLLFFLHRDPSEEGPVRLRMIPFSRMKCLISLKHMCRFAILPYVRRDKIQELSIPECLQEYLNEPFMHSHNHN